MDSRGGWVGGRGAYLRAAVDGLPSVHHDVAQGVVAVQLHRVELSQFDGVGVPDGGHPRAHVEPEEAKTEDEPRGAGWASDESFCTDRNSKRPPTSPSEAKSAPVLLLWPL